MAYERPAPDIRMKGLKTGKNREFLQKTVLLAIFYTTQTRMCLQTFGVFTLPRIKIPYKNNREFFVTYQGIISEYQGILFQPPPHTKQTKMRQYYPTLTLWYVCDSLYTTKGLAMAEIKKIFNEYGLGQSSEIEYTDGTESRTNKRVKINHIQARYFRIWIGKKVLIIDSDKPHFSIRDKKRWNFKVVYGRSGR